MLKSKIENYIYQLLFIMIYLILSSCGGGGGGDSAQHANINISSFLPPSGYSGTGTSADPYNIIISNSNDAKITITYQNTSGISSNFYVILPTSTGGVNNYTVNSSSTTCGTSNTGSIILASQASCNLVISPSTIGGHSYPFPSISSNGFTSQPTINGQTSFSVNFGTTFNIYLGAVDASENNLLYKCIQYTCIPLSTDFGNSGNGVYIAQNSSNILYIGVDSNMYYLNGDSNIITIESNITNINGDHIQSVIASESYSIIGTHDGIISQCSTTSCEQLINLSSNLEELFQVISIESTIYALGTAKNSDNSVIYSNLNGWASPVLNLSIDSYGIINSIDIKNNSLIYLGGKKEDNGILYSWNGSLSSIPNIYESNLGGGGVTTMQLTDDKSSLYVTAASSTYKCDTTKTTMDCPSQSITGFNGLSSTSFENNVYFGGTKGSVHSSIIDWQDPFIKIDNFQGGKITSVSINQ